MPTKKEIQEYLNLNHKNTVLMASIHFDMEVGQVWKILQESDIASCSSAKEDELLCKACARNTVSDNNITFKLKVKKGNINPTCDGYINKNNGSLL